jgi:hypothetical protein
VVTSPLRWLFPRMHHGGVIRLRVPRLAWRLARELVRRRGFPLAACVVGLGERLPYLGGARAEGGPGPGGVLVQCTLLVLVAAARGGGLVAVPGGLDFAVLFLPAGGAQLLGDVFGGPGGFGLIRTAAGQELPVGQVAHGDAFHPGHGGERGVPLRPRFGVGARGFGADRFAGVVPAGDLPVGAELPGSPLPIRACLLPGGNGAEGLGGPQRLFPGGVLADAALPVIHGDGHLGQVAGQFGVGVPGQTGHPGLGDSRGQVPGGPADAGIQHRRMRARPSEGVARDRRLDDVGAHLRQARSGRPARNLCRQVVAAVQIVVGARPRRHRVA